MKNKLKGVEGLVGIFIVIIMILIGVYWSFTSDNDYSKDSTYQKLRELNK